MYSGPYILPLVNTSNLKLGVRIDNAFRLARAQMSDIYRQIQYLAEI